VCATASAKKCGNKNVAGRGMRFALITNARACRIKKEMHLNPRIALTYL
jgi:hypothetical protein